MKIKNTILKSLSLGVGLSLGIILMAKVCYEMSYDRCYTDSDRIFMIKVNGSIQGEALDYDQISGAVAPGMKQYVPGIAAATRTTGYFSSDKYRDENNNLIKGRMNFADSSFFDVFPTEILAGNPKTALSKWGSTMVSRSFAEKLGGVQEVLGKTIANEEQPGLHFTIDGVFEDFPYLSSRKFDVLASMETYSKRSTENWVGNDRYKGYVRLEKGVDYQTLEPAIRLMQEKNQPLDELEKQGFSIRYYLAPLGRLHTEDKYIRNVIIILIVIAILLIAISLLNYIMIAISETVSRFKEISVRKCYGAGAVNIYSMMFGEAAVNVLSALVFSSIIILATRSTIEDMAGIPVWALFIPQTYAVTAAVCVLIFFAAGFVPARLCTGIPVAMAIRNYKGNKRVWKRALLFVQIGISALLINLVAVIGGQYRKALNDNPGYAYRNVIYIPLRGTDRSTHQALIDKLLTLSEVNDVQLGSGLPLEGYSGNNVSLPGNDETLFNIADSEESTTGLFELLEIPFTEGHAPRTRNDIAVSESFVEHINNFADWSDGAVGKQIVVTGHDSEPYTICGIYKDFRIGTMSGPDTRPSVSFFGSVGDYLWESFVKVNNLSPEVLESVKAVMDEFYPSRDNDVLAYADLYRDAYSRDKMMRNCVFAGSIICIVIAIFGLIGYIRDETERRSKEMAIRKINGAQTDDVLKIFVKEITILSIVAVISGSIGAYFCADIWLESFSERIALSPLIFIISDAAILLATSGMAYINCLKISHLNPIVLLRSE